jgi:hypothetical protein
MSRAYLLMFRKLYKNILINIMRRSSFRRFRQASAFYLPIHVDYKDSSTTTRVCAVFDALAITSTGVSLNSTLMVRPTVHPPFIDVLNQVL